MSAPIASGRAEDRTEANGAVAARVVPAGRVRGRIVPKPARVAIARALLVAAALGGALGGATARAEEGQEGEVEPSLIKRVEGFMDDTQRRASERLLGFVDSVDGFFGEGTEASGGNDSWARLRLEASQPGDEDLSFDATIKLRIVLPQAERRFRLLLSSEEEERGSVISGQDAVTPERIDGGNRENVSLALRFIRTARETSRVNFDVGARQREGAVQAFGRINATAEGEMRRYWQGRVSNNYYYYSKSGYENRLRFSAIRPILRSRNFFFQTTTAFGWRKGRKGAAIGETLGLYAELNDRTTVAFEALAGYSTSLNGSQSARYGGTEIRVRWRQNVWRPWFHYEIWPSVAWPSSNDYERAWGGLVRVEMVFGRVR